MVVRPRAAFQIKKPSEVPICTPVSKCMPHAQSHVKLQSPLQQLNRRHFIT
jgi:hypothetical protein